jgi:hypothetical protein
MFLRLLFVVCLVAATSAQTIDADRDALFAAIRRGAAGDLERLLAAGATVVREERDWTGLTDPEGNEFCAVPAGE